MLWRSLRTSERRASQRDPPMVPCNAEMICPAENGQSREATAQRRNVRGETRWHRSPALRFARRPSPPLFRVTGTFARLVCGMIGLRAGLVVLTQACFAPTDAQHCSQLPESGRDARLPHCYTSSQQIALIGFPFDPRWCTFVLDPLPCMHAVGFISSFCSSCVPP